jgi:hypothetical protein
MRKFLPAALCAFAALAYSQLSPAADPSATIDPVKQGQPPAASDAKGDANPAAPTASDNARPERRSADPAGAAQDSSQNAAAGGTSSNSSRKATKREDRSGRSAGPVDSTNGPLPQRYSH